METKSLAPVQFTQSAVEEIVRILDAAKTDETTHLRVGVKGGGCSGMTYVLEM